MSSLAYRRSSRPLVFGSCVMDKYSMNPKWTNIDRLVSCLNHELKPKIIINVAQKGLRYQIFDFSLWGKIYNSTIQVQELYSPNDWVTLLHIYRRMKIHNQELYNIAYQHLINKLHLLSLEETSKLISSYAYFTFRPTLLYVNVANQIIEKYQRHRENSLNQRDIAPFIHLLCAYSKCNTENRQLFETVAEVLLKLLEVDNVTVPSHLILKLIQSFHQFGYRHSQLFDLLSREIVTSKFSASELNTIKTIFDSLNYKNELLYKTLTFKLANIITS